MLIDAAICHLHPEILRADTAIGVTPIVVARALPSSDKTRDGTGRAAAFLQESALHAATDLKKEAEGGALFLHTSGSTGEHLARMTLPHFASPSSFGAYCFRPDWTMEDPF